MKTITLTSEEIAKVIAAEFPKFHSELSEARFSALLTALGILSGDNNDFRREVLEYIDLFSR